jgi:phospholipid/cholesterol/gamma-HCH transport system substrate-binding protein
MNERQLQFRVGLFAITAMMVMATLLFQFGEVRTLLEKQYQILVHFDSAPGVLEGSPVRLNGIPIGDVDRISLDRKRGGVLLTLSIDEKYSLRGDSIPRLQQSLLGDAAIEFTPGVSSEPFDRQTILEGSTPPDVMEVVLGMENQLAQMMASFDATSREWQQLARNVNSLVETNQGSLHDVVQRTATSLDEFTKTMQRAGSAFENANRVIADPRTVANLQKALAGLPQIVNETQQTISAMRQTVSTINGNLRNIENVTAPLAKHTTSIVVRLDNSLSNLEAMTGELRDVAQIASKSDGSLKRFLSDPQLYDDLERSASSLAILLRNLEPIVQDMRVFTDKVARHPEVLGVGGALRPSSGLKDDEIRRAEFQKPK